MVVDLSCLRALRIKLNRYFVGFLGGKATTATIGAVKCQLRPLWSPRRWAFGCSAGCEFRAMTEQVMGIPKIRGTFMGVPTIRDLFPYTTPYMFFAKITLWEFCFLGTASVVDTFGRRPCFERPSCN